MSNSDSSPKTTLPAVILAGGVADPEMAAKYSIENRAEVPIAGKMMLRYVFDAIRASTHIDDIYVVGNIKCDAATKIIPPGQSLLDNLIAGVKACSSDASDRLVMVSTSDIPFVSTEAIDDLISRCTDPDIDFYYPVIPREACEKRFPGMKRTYARLAEGTFTGGNIMLMRSGFVLKNADLINKVFSARKSVLRLAGLIGLPTMLRAIIAQVFMPKALDLLTLEKTVGRIINARVKAVPIHYAEIGSDVDDLAQVEFAESVLKSAS